MLFWFIFPVWKTDGSVGQAAKARAMESREREPAPAVQQRRQESYFLGFVLGFLVFIFLLFWGGNGNFPCRRSLLPKNCCCPGVVERKRCRWARFRSGSAPADRDVWLSRPGHPCCPPGLDRRESESFTSRTAFRKQRNSPRTKMLFLSSYQHSGDLHRAGVKVLREGKQKQVTNADAPGFHEVAARKKKRSHEIPLCSTRI